MIFFFKRHLERLRDRAVFKLPFILTLKQCEIMRCTETKKFVMLIRERLESFENCEEQNTFGVCFCFLGLEVKTIG